MWFIRIRISPVLVEVFIDLTNGNCFYVYSFIIFILGKVERQNITLSYKRKKRPGGTYWIRKSCYSGFSASDDDKQILPRPGRTAAKGICPSRPCYAIYFYNWWHFCMQNGMLLFLPGCLDKNDVCLQPCIFFLQKNMCTFFFMFFLSISPFSGLWSYSVVQFYKLQELFKPFKDPTYWVE